MTVMSMGAVEIALASHLKTWLPDYLGVQEIRDGLRRGGAARPRSWVRSEERPDAGGIPTLLPAVYVVSRGPAEGTLKRRPQVGVLQAEIVIEVCAGILPRTYLGALLQLLEVERGITEDLTVARVLGGVVTNLDVRGGNGDHLN